jgi:DNA polymerase-3 subunit alpha
MSKMVYCPLHSHSDASISDGLFGPKRWAKAFKEMGFQASALTDHGTMANIIPLYKLMKEQGLTLIVGCEFYYVDDPLDKSPDNRKNSHLILLAKNYDGFQNMLKLSELSHTEGYYYKNRIGMEWLKKHSENLVCLTACQGGILANQVWRERKGDDCVGLENKFHELRNIFGKDLYVEFQGHKTPNYDDVTKELFCSQEMINKAFYERLRKEKGFQPILTNDSHYILPEHADIQRVMKEMAYGKSDTGESATVTKDHFTDSLWLKNHKQVYEAFRKNHEYLPKEFVVSSMLNTVEVFEKCKDFEFPKGKRYLPTYTPTKEESDRFGETDSKKFFKAIAISQFNKMWKDGVLCHATKNEYMARFKKEYEVISKYGLEDYFLIVWDLIHYAHKNNIYTGLGRGSAAGCLISYLLGIVKIDPLEHKLIFERFLNENRCSSGELPDIDTDFESIHRGQIKRYIFEKYGKDKVCEIGTYGRMKLKTSLLDFGKAYGAGTHRDLLNITKNLDLDKEDVDDLKAAIDQDPALERLMNENPDYEFAVKECIGQIKSQGVHPAGLIICSEPVAHVTPVKSQVKKKTDEFDELDEDGEKRIIATQTEDKHVIAQGLMKVDILGVKQYDIIKYVIEHAETGFTRDNYVTEIMRREREKPDQKIWKMFQRGLTDGVFQFSSSGMKELLVQMKPNCVNDLIAANALYRPGCLENGWHTLYCNRKHGLEGVDYVHEDVEEALSDTYGVIVFQEQFMEVIHKLGGISLVESDIIRSALGKKDKEKLAKFRDKFVEGASKKISEDDADELWSQIEKASGYSFNRSHSAAYAVLAYISQYLKVYHTSHFWCANLQWAVVKKKEDELSFMRKASVEMGVKHRLPEINTSKSDFYVAEDGTIVWGFLSVNGVGPQAAKDLERLQPFYSFDDFIDKTKKSKIKKNNIEGLIQAGAFDRFGDRKDLLFRIHDTKTKKAKTDKPFVTPSEIDLILKFRDSMGFFEQQVKKARPGFSRYCITQKELEDYDAGEHIRVGGIITNVSVIKTKRGESMCFITLEDMDELIEVTCFPSVYEDHKKVIKKGSIVEIQGTKSAYNGKTNCVEASAVELK